MKIIKLFITWQCVHYWHSEGERGKKSRKKQITIYHEMWGEEEEDWDVMQ